MTLSSKSILSFALLLVASTSAASDDDGFQPTQAQANFNEMAELTMKEHEESDILSPSVLEQVHVITRHGARTMLSKDADSLAEAGGATLTPLGQQQLFDLGQWLQFEYLDVLAVTQDPDPTVTEFARSLAYYNPNLHLFESSNLDRTLSSANALAKGLFPTTERASGAHNTPPSDPEYFSKELFDSPLKVPVPVYTTGKDNNDVTLRAYKNCPTFKDRLNKLYRSKEWKQIESDFAPTLEKLAEFFPEMAVDGKVPLKDVWDAYDAIHVARTECLDNPNNNDHCQAFLSQDDVINAATIFTTEKFEQLEQLVEHTEFLKFGAGLDTSPEDGMVTAGNLLGSNLLWKILNRSKGDGDFFMYSAHFPTLLGLLSTMQASQDFWRDSGGEKFFEYGSALIVEIHKSQDKGVRYFLLKYKSSDSNEAVPITIRESATGIKCGQDDSSGLSMIPKASWCLLDEVIAWSDIYTLRTEEAWCKACNNKEADVCLAPKRSSSTLDMWAANAETMGYTTAPGATTIICLLFFGGFSAGVLMMWMVWCCTGNLVVKRRSKTMDLNDSLMKLDDSTSSLGDGSKEEAVVTVQNKEIC